ncbi:DUF3231 family protein [Neobacillus mesonae]|uniref:DUF3231 family protein n=1 Tax=Neobacillus mesonae TaxID=1193713 RepID=UPI00203AE3B6|nr:DUF3231 family protein [Neobacillus mesonae]MCM3569790.1 DUF3231 family protein [Neobacillus mesonae]
MEKNNIKLTAAEIASLWKTYIQSTAVRCFYKHFLQHLQDTEIQSIVEEFMILVETIIGKVKTIFEEENFPMPNGFSDKDVDLSAPALYTDLFALSYAYRVGQVTMPHYTNVLTKATRLDIYDFFKACLHNETELHKKALALMLSKGLNDRPPKMEYPVSVEYVKQHPSLLNTWLGEKRPLNCLEIAELYQDIERNAIGLVALMGLLQVTKDKEIKDYLLKGKKLAEDQIETFEKLLKVNHHFSGTPVTMEVTNSTISPFSEKLILFFISSSNQAAISTLGDALSVSMRKDIAAHYSLFLTNVIRYSEEGLKLMVKRGWMEQPPQTIDRNELYKN